MKARLAVLLSLALAATYVSAAKPDRWMEGHTPHFHILSNTKPKDAERAAQQLEEFHHLLSLMFPGLQLEPPLPAMVLLFKNRKSFEPYLPAGATGKPEKLGGFMQPGAERMQLAVNLDAPGSREALFHEYIHLVLALNLADVPVWLNEGLAEFYEQTEIDRMEFTIGNWQPGWWDLLQRHDLIPLKALVETDYHARPFENEKQRELFYAESWLLVHYVMVSDEGRRRSHFVRFVELLRQGSSQEAAFRDSFGTDFQGMERQLRDYLSRRSVAFFHGRMTTAAEKRAVEFRPVEPGVAQAYLADLWINRGDLERAERALAPLLVGGSAPTEVLDRLGRIALRRQQWQEAEKYFRQALAVRPDDPALRYHAAWAISQGRLGAPGNESARQAAANEVIELLAPVVDTLTHFVNAYPPLVEARLARDDPPGELIPLLERARALAPQRHEFDFLLAHLYQRSQRWADAEQLLRQIAARATAGDERAQAERWLQELRQRQSRPAARHSEAESPESAQPAAPPAAEAVEPPPAPPEIRYLRGRLTEVACSGEAAILTIETEGKPSKEERLTRLAVRSRSRVIVADPTDSGWKLECGAADVPVAINYRVEPQENNVAGVVISIELHPPKL
ncbi:MAG: tetratricopeptide repeat protein [Acidobacteria bacterium]|nr:tetratricopeptide repeat protein [Acidobacteriota bacterium]